MLYYRVTNRVTGETQKVAAPSAQTACEALGWLIGNCHIKLLKKNPYSGFVNRRQHISAENEARLRDRLRNLQPASAAEAKGRL